MTPVAPPNSGQQSYADIPTLGVPPFGGHQLAGAPLSKQGVPPLWLALYQTQQQQLEQQQQQLQYQQHHQWQVQQHQALGSPPFYGGAHTPQLRTPDLEVDPTQQPPASAALTVRAPGSQPALHFYFPFMAAAKLQISGFAPG